MGLTFDTPINYGNGIEIGTNIYSLQYLLLN